MRLKIRTKDIAIMAIYAALYAALVVVLGPLSYGPIQIRIADSLLAVVPLLGLAGVLGHTLGVFVGNIYSIAGPIDLLNTIPSFAMSFAVYYFYKRTKTRLYSNWNMRSLLCSFRYDSRMDAVFLIQTATPSHHSLCRHWNYDCNRSYRLANF
jgi:uncharacterized membrane protein